jgi:integrase
MYAVMQYPNSLALRASLETGLRINDILSLTTKQLVKRKIFGIAEKTGKPFERTLSIDLAKRLKEISGKKYIFQGRLSEEKHRTRQAVWKDMKKAAAILELEGNFAPHSARKTYAVEKFKDGGLAVVKKDLQHKDISTTMLYAFADYLDEVPSAVNDFRTSVRKSENEAEAGETKEKPPSVPLDGDFWVTFADLVAEKTAEKLLEKIKAIAG